MPVASITRLFNKYNGKQGVEIKTSPSSLDIAASRTDGRVYLHVANLKYTKSVEATFAVTGMNITGGRVYQIAPEDLRTYVNTDQPDVFKPSEVALRAGPAPKWRFPAGSVSVVELDVQPG
jgi:hypothetical protein